MPAHYTCIHTHLQTCEGFLTAGPRGEKEGTAKKVASKVFGGGISPAKLLQGAFAGESCAVERTGWMTWMGMG